MDMNIKLSDSQKKADLKQPESIAAIMQQVLKRENRFGRSQEHFWVVGLSQSNKLLFAELIALGRHNRVTANPPDVFRMAIYKLAPKIILVHNHPSGNMLPSTADKSFTDRIIKVGEMISVQVIDHIIISEDDYISFDELAIMDELRKSNTWRVVQKEETEVREMMDRMKRLSAEEANSKKIAKKLKAMGLNDGEIKKATGLRLVDIREL